MKEWDGPFEVHFDVLYTVIGFFPKGDPFTDTLWAEDARHASEKAVAANENLSVLTVLYGEVRVAA